MSHDRVVLTAKIHKIVCHYLKYWKRCTHKYATAHYMKETFKNKYFKIDLEVKIISHKEIFGEDSPGRDLTDVSMVVGTRNGCLGKVTQHNHGNSVY